MEQKNYKRTTVTAALPYANGGVHIGHLAGVYVPADIYVRYLRLRGEDVVFIGGSDEHGVPITIRARKEGVTPQDVVDRFHTMIKQSFEEFGVSFDIYSRTTSDIHHQFAADWFRKLYDAGKLKEQTTTQLYDEEAHQFLADRYIVGECPHCHNEGAYGDQCEKCGRDLSPTELINPRSTISGSTPVLRETKNWYLPLNDYQQWLKEWILEGHKEWRSNVYGQCKSWLDMDLQPRAMTRDLDWGIPVPVEGVEGKVLYVWFDAPIGYVSNTKELCERAPERWGDWRKWWQDDETRLVHFIGKDNIVFHCIIFPVMMKAWNESSKVEELKSSKVEELKSSTFQPSNLSTFQPSNLSTFQPFNSSTFQPSNLSTFILPDNVPANEFLNLEDNKISTSKNWAVWLHEYLVDFPGKQDVLRYVLTANAPETKDNNFTWRDFQDRNNNELVAVYGNFVNRALQLTKKYWQGVVPECGPLLDVDQHAIAEFKDVKQKVESLLDQFKFREAQFEAMNLARIGNRYITECEPWKIWKKVSAIPSESEESAAAEERVRTILYLSLQLTANLAIAFEPFLPFSSKRLREMLHLDSFEWGQLGRTDILQPGHQLAEPSLLFEKIDDDAIQAQLDRLERIKKENAQNSEGHQADSDGQVANGADNASEAAAYGPEPVKPIVSFDDFERLDIRVGHVLSCEKVKKSKKLLQFSIDDGTGTPRTILSGIAEWNEPEQLVGRDVLFIANFAPRKIMGVESQGMILSAVDSDGSLVPASLLRGVKPGSQVG